MQDETKAREVLASDGKGWANVIPADREAWIEYEDFDGAFADRVRTGSEDDTCGLQIIARHRLAFASAPPDGEREVKTLADQTGAPGRVVIGRDDPLYKAFRPSPETITAIEKDEQANAQGLAAIRDMMFGHVTNWPEPKRFGTAIALVDKTLHAALSLPHQADREAIARVVREHLPHTWASEDALRTEAYVEGLADAILALSPTPSATLPPATEKAEK